MVQSRKNVLTLEKARDAYKDLSGKASDISRQLGFAGIALIWIFRVEIAGRPSVPSTLLLPGLLIVVSLACDLAQYVTGAVSWGVFSRLREEEDDNEFTAPYWINWPSLAFFWAKLAFMTVAYTFLIKYLLQSNLY